MLTLIAAPNGFPVSLAEAKAHLRVTHDDEDAVISGMIGAATSLLEGPNGILGRALITQTWRLAVPYLRYRETLPLAPVQSIQAVTYIDTDDAQQTIAATDYRHVGDLLEFDEAIPGAAVRSDAFRVDFVVGYGEAADVPEPIRMAMLLLIGQWYEHRSTVGQENGEMPFAFRQLTAPYRVMNF